MVAVLFGGEYEKAIQAFQKEDYVGAVKIWQKLSNEGDARAKTDLATMYENGMSGLTQDYKKAIELYKEAIKEEYGIAAQKLGACYEYGRGVKKSLSKAKAYYIHALKLYEVAAIKGDVDAQYKLTNIYEYGIGEAEVSPLKSAYYLQLMVDNGAAIGQAALAGKYMNGDGVLKQDYPKALELFQKAAEQGNTGAQHNLCYMYMNGLGTKKDDRKAFLFCQKALKQGRTAVQANIDIICKRSPNVCK